MRKSASEVIAEGDLSAVVDLAIDLNREVSAAEKELNELKVYLRGVARSQKHGAAEVELEGLSGTISVTFPGLQLKTKKGVDLRDLEVNIGPAAFAKLFLRTIEIVPAMPPDDFLEVLATLSPADQAKIKNFIAISEQTAKVYVPR
jgi:hypothetical protein